MHGASPSSPESRRARLNRALEGRCDELLTPFLVIDLDAVEHNARAMVDRLEGHSDRWRPHIKTVKQSRVLGALLDAGVRNFKCATLSELSLLLDSATSHDPEVTIDVLWAYPAHAASLRALAVLWQARSDRDRHRVTLIADDIDHLHWLDGQAAPGVFGVMPDVDLGMARTGRPPSHWRRGFDAKSTGPVTSNLELRGVHGYDGHHRWDERAMAHARYGELRDLAGLVSGRRPERGSSLPLDVVTSGTHSFEHALAFNFGPEVRHQVSPGTIVLSDLRSASAAQSLGLRQAAFVGSRVVSRTPERITLDAGSKGISPDGPAPSCAVLEAEGLSPGVASEEHLPVVCDLAVGSPPAFGTMLFLVPSHVCTTVNMHRQAVYVRDDVFVGVGEIEAAGHPLFVDGASS